MQINDILRAYSARNITTVYQNQYPVWQVGCVYVCTHPRVSPVCHALFKRSAYPSLPPPPPLPPPPSLSLSLSLYTPTTCQAAHLGGGLRLAPSRLACLHPQQPGSAQCHPLLRLKGEPAWHALIASNHLRPCSCAPQAGNGNDFELDVMVRINPHQLALYRWGGWAGQTRGGGGGVWPQGPA